MPCGEWRQMSFLQHLLKHQEGEIAASISATMFLCGMVVGVGANFGPFSKRDRSSGERGLLERFTTQLFLSMMD